MFCINLSFHKENTFLVRRMQKKMKRRSMSGTTCINVVRGNSLAGPTSNAFLTSESISRYAFSRIRSIENNKYVISLFAINREARRSSVNPGNVWCEKITIADPPGFSRITFRRWRAGASARRGEARRGEVRGRESE